MKLIIVTLSNATITSTSILDYFAQGDTLFLTTKSGTFKIVFGAKEGVKDANEKSNVELALKAKTDIDTLLVSAGNILKLENCEIWH